MHPRQAAVLLLVRSGDDAVLDGDSLRYTPKRRHFDLVDAVSPRVPLRQSRFIQTIGQLQLVKLTTGESSHLRERRLNLVQHLRRQHPLEIRTQHAIVLVLIAEFRGRLLEGHEQRFTQMRQFSKMVPQFEPREPPCQTKGKNQTYSSSACWKLTSTAFSLSIASSGTPPGTVRWNAFPASKARKCSEKTRLSSSLASRKRVKMTTTGRHWPATAWSPKTVRTSFRKTAARVSSKATTRRATTNTAR